MFKHKGKNSTYFEATAKGTIIQHMMIGKQDWEWTIPTYMHESLLAELTTAAEYAQKGVYWTSEDKVYDAQTKQWKQK